MKANIFKIVAIMLTLTGILTVTLVSCANEIDPKYDIYENHEISACAISDPLQNMGWLKEYCDSIKETQHIASVSIDLYKVIDTNEHLFKIGISYSDLEASPFLYSESWRNCTGEFIFNINSGTPPNPELIERFMKDKEHVAELFYCIKQKNIYDEK